jgi:hypothetical protein
MMTEHNPPEHLADLQPETREFLSGLSKEDIATLKTGLPIIRLIIGFGIASKWLAITVVGILVGTVMLGDAIAKIFGWMRGP